MRRLGKALAVLVPAMGAVNAARAAGAAQAQAPGVVIAGADSAAWSGSAGLMGFFVPRDRDFVQGTLAADRRRLHLEARYN